MRDETRKRLASGPFGETHDIYLICIMDVSRGPAVACQLFDSLREAARKSLASSSALKLGSRRT